MDAVSAHASLSETSGQSKAIPRARVVGLLDAFVFNGTLAVILLTAIPYGTVAPWSIALFECFIFALTATWIIQGALIQQWDVPNKVLLIPPAATFVFAVVQTLPNGSPTLSQDPYQTQLWTFQFGALVLTGAILLRHTSTSRRLNALVAIVIVVGVLSAVFGLLRHALNFELPVQGFLKLSDQGSYAQFINRNHFAMLMEISLGLLAGIVVAGGFRGFLLAMLVASGLVLWVALVLSNSRGGVVAMLGQLLFLIAFWKRGKQSSPAIPDGALSKVGRSWAGRLGRVFLAASLTILVGVGVVWVGGDSVLHRWEILPRELRTQNEARDNSSRLAIWKATVGMIRDYPLLGVGFGAYSTKVPGYHDASGIWVPEEAHNDYLELAASGGIVAVVLTLIFIGLLIKLSKRCFATASDPLRRAACFGAQIGLVGIAIHSFVDFGLHVTLNAVMFVVLVVIATRIIPSSLDASDRGLA